MTLKIDTQTLVFNLFEKTLHIIFHKVLMSYHLLSLVDVYRSVMLQISIVKSQTTDKIHNTSKYYHSVYNLCKYVLTIG